MTRWFWEPIDPFEAVARWNGDMAKSAWQSEQTKRSRSSGLVTREVKEARRAKNKRARQARQKQRRTS